MSHLPGCPLCSEIGGTVSNDDPDFAKMPRNALMSGELWCTMP